MAAGTLSLECPLKPRHRATQRSLDKVGGLACRQNHSTSNSPQLEIRMLERGFPLRLP